MITLVLDTNHPITGEKLHLRARAGEIAVICGRSGRGKSTLLGQIWGSRPLEEGCILNLRMNGQSFDLGTCSAAELAYLRPRVMSYVEQNPIILKRDFISSWFKPKGPRLKVAMQAFDLAPELLNRRAGEVSGGERQRFLLLKAILSDCPILLLDEPFTGLDATRRLAATQLLSESVKEGRLIILTDHVTHNFQQVILGLD